MYCERFTDNNTLSDCTVAVIMKDSPSTAITFHYLLQQFNSSERAARHMSIKEISNYILPHAYAFLLGDVYVYS